MLSIHLTVLHFVDEDETKYETDEINNGNMNEFCIFIADQKSENTKNKTRREEGSKRRTFSMVKRQ